MIKLFDNKKLVYGLIISMVLLGIFVRYQFLSSHFSHVDDLTPIRTILEWSKYPVYPMWHSELVDDSIFSILDNLGLLKIIAKLVDVKNQVFGISKSSTYAPLQFFLTALFIRPGMNYQQFLFWGRFPSFLFGSLNIVFIGYLIYKFVSKNKLTYSLLAIVLTSISLENIIYSVQMESYEIGVFITSILFILFLFKIEKYQNNWKFDLLIIGFILLCSWSQYQFIFFLPGFYIGLFVFAFTKKNKSLFYKYLILSIINIFLLIPLYLFMNENGLLIRGVNWNAGVNGEFLFSFNGLNSITEYISYLVNFFAKNSILITKSNFMIGNGFVDHTIYFVLLTIIMVIGLIKLVKSNKPLFAFISVTIGIWMILVLIGSLTLSPTRHSLILFPMQLLLLILGIEYIITKNNLKEFENLITVLSILLVLFFIVSIPDIYKERKDPFDQYKIYDLLNNYDVDFISSYDWTWNLQLMDYEMLYLFDNGYFMKLHDYTSNTLAIVSHRNQIDESTFSYIISGLNENTYEDYSLDMSKYEMIYSEEINSDVEIDVLNLTKNGTNSYYFYIFKVIDSFQ